MGQKAEPPFDTLVYAAPPIVPESLMPATSGLLILERISTGADAPVVVQRNALPSLNTPATCVARPVTGLFMQIELSLTYWPSNDTGVPAAGMTKNVPMHVQVLVQYWVHSGDIALLVDRLRKSRRSPPDR
jgi:hypothetical protein